MRELVEVLGYQVDPTEGLVYGLKGKPFFGRSRCGYIPVGRHSKHIGMAHRLIWMAVHGAIPDGLQINHKNGIKHDNRIENLELVTASENVRHAHRTGLTSPLQGSACPASKLTDQDVTNIRLRHSHGEKQAAIARDYGITREAVGLITRRVNWRHVP